MNSYMSILQKIPRHQRIFLVKYFSIQKAKNLQNTTHITSSFSLETQLHLISTSVPISTSQSQSTGERVYLRNLLKIANHKRDPNPSKLLLKFFETPLDEVTNKEQIFKAILYNKIELPPLDFARAYGEMLACYWNPANRGQCMGKAKELRREILTNEIALIEKLMDTLIEVYLSEHNPLACLHLIEQFTIQQRQTPSAFWYSQIIATLRSEETIEHVLNHLRFFGVKLNAKIYTALISSFSRMKRTEKVKYYFHQCQNYTMELTDYCSQISALAKVKMVEEATDLYLSLFAKNIPISDELVTAVYQVLQRKAGRVDEKLYFWSCVRDSRVKLTSEIMDELLFCLSLSHLPAVYYFMKREGIQPTNTTFYRLMQRLFVENRFKMNHLITYIKDMKDTGVTLSDDTMNAMLHIFLREYGFQQGYQTHTQWLRFMGSNFPSNSTTDTISTTDNSMKDFTKKQDAVEVK